MIDPLGHLGAVQHLIDELRQRRRAQSHLAGFNVGAYGVAYRRFATEGRGPEAAAGEVILFGLDAANREFALRLLPDEVEGFLAKVRMQANLARGLPAEGVPETLHQTQARMIGETVLQLMQTVPLMHIDAGYFVSQAPSGQDFEILVRLKKEAATAPGNVLAHAFQPLEGVPHACGWRESPDDVVCGFVREAHAPAEGGA